MKSLSNNASILSGTESVNAKEKQSVFGMLSLGYHGLFVDGTFRNDWSSSLPKANNSYFYASGSASAVLTEIFPKPEEQDILIRQVARIYCPRG